MKTRLFIGAACLAGCVGLQPGRAYRASSEALGSRATTLGVEQTLASPDDVPPLEMPKALEWRGAHGLTPVERVLPSGVRLVVLRRRDFPIATAYIVVAHHDHSSPAVSAVYGQAALEPRPSLSDSPDQALGGARLGWGITGDAAIASVTTVSPVLPGALGEVLHRFVAPPALRDDDIAFSKLGLLAARGGTTSSGLAEQAAMASVYPSRHRYATSMSLIEPDAIRSVTRDDLVRFGKDHVSAQNITLVVVGDVDVEVVAAVANRELSTIQHLQSIAPTTAPAPSRCRGVPVLIDRPSATQFAIFVAHRAVGGSDDDAPALRVLTAAAGGSLSSRLSHAVREGLGATYGVNARALLARLDGAVTVSALLETSKAGDAIGAILRELDRLRTDLLDEESLEIAKGVAARTDPTSELLSAVIDGRPLPHFGARDPRLDRVTSKQVLASAVSYLDPKQRCIFVVGDARQLEPVLRSLGNVELRR